MRGPGFMTSNTSKTVYVKMAPWRMSSLVPRALRSAAEPGMAKRRGPASITTILLDIPDMMWL